MIQQALLEFLQEKGITPHSNLKEVNTFEIIDSMGFLELLNFLEQRTGAELDFSTFDLEDFATLEGLIATIDKALRAQNVRL
ncbi:hypothetical protein [Helicobacter sp.]|uniref:acyl carrier protein n=1 Tax=Helicobacter sp. TaxID=218 RepID=UPI00198A6995|nr:hypothetical protein [Helicobacter sp.]MBD5164694.1 hypothetical protein [Helicobacter sp.]